LDYSRLLLLLLLLLADAAIINHSLTYTTQSDQRQRRN